MILRGSVFSKTLEMDTGITVVGPDTFHPEKPCKVAYMLHGLCGGNGDWANYTMLPVYAKEYDVMFILPEVARSFYSDMKYGLKYFSYVTEELPDICRSVFNISAKREDTAVMGASMGGYGALKCALSKPSQYGVCCAFSSACLFLKEGLNRQRESGNQEELKAIHGEQLLTDFLAIFGETLEWSPGCEILELAGRADKNVVRPKIYCACGIGDFLQKDNAQFSREMQAFHFDLTYEEWPGAHDWAFFNEALCRALRQCYGD